MKKSTDKKINTNSRICLPMINLTPTMKCNLKCRLCGVLVPQYEYRPQMTVDEFTNVLNAVFQITDRVEKLQITGGEPLIHPELPQMIEECFKYCDQFDRLWLFTNCAVALSSDLVEVLKKYRDKILIHASDYGLRREITDKFLQDLEIIGCEYRYLKYFGDDQYSDGWVDQGDFIKHNRTEEELEKVFSRCSHVCRGGSWYVRGSQMHWCGRSIRGCEVGKIPLNRKDYLDIFDGSLEMRRQKMRKLMQVKSIAACDYCNGYYGTADSEKRYPAGEQV